MEGTRIGTHTHTHRLAYTGSGDRTGLLREKGNWTQLGLTVSKHARHGTGRMEREEEDTQAHSQAPNPSVRQGAIHSTARMAHSGH